MTRLDDLLDEYVRIRRGLGFKIEATAHLGHQFCAWLAEHGKPDSFTIDDVVVWALLPDGGTRSWHGRHLQTLRPFAAYLNAAGYDVPVIPPGLLPAGNTRAVPYIYTQDEVDTLMDACAHVFHGDLYQASMRTIIGLLSATGIRIGEALHLTCDDIDIAGDVMLIKAGKSATDRYVPLHPTTTEALVTYLGLPDRLATQPDPHGPVFVTKSGVGYRDNKIDDAYLKLTKTVGILPKGKARPRLHCHRHTFATSHMVAAYTRPDGNPQHTLAMLATWLGHTSPVFTYWYLSAVPELMVLAAQRLEQHKNRERQ